jgi:hypothetical protein
MSTDNLSFPLVDFEDKMSQPSQITLEVAVSEIVTGMLIYTAFAVLMVMAAVSAADLCERAYNFFWKVHDEED